MRHVTTRIALLGATVILSLLASLGAGAAPASAASPSSCGSNLQCVISFGDARIDERLAALNVLIGRVNAHPYLTASQKSALVSDANTNISGLNTLKSKLDAETSVSAARADVQSIYTQFRIFAVVLPRDYAEIWLDHEMNAHDALVGVEPTLQSLITDASNQGLNVTQEQQQYQDMGNKLADSATQDSNASALIPSLIPSNYPGTAQTFQQMRSDLKQGHSDILGAFEDAKNIVQELKSILVKGPSTNVTATPTP
jgi:hypothetical protein